jgi:hypothetical protein
MQPKLTTTAGTSDRLSAAVLWAINH